MNNKLIILICFIFLLSLIMIGCSTSLRNENASLSKQVIALQEKNMNMDNTIAALENTIKELDNKLKIQDMRIESFKKSAFDKKENLYPIYTADIYTFAKLIDAFIYIPKEATIKKKLEALAKVLSEVYFDNLPIQIVKIKEIDNKKIAIVNLKESAVNQGVTDYTKLVGKTWTTLYMQGSTGGTVTSTRLIETMLQKDYIGEWVDGVQFLYNGGTCYYEHAPSLKDINYRAK